MKIFKPLKLEDLLKILQILQNLKSLQNLNLNFLKYIIYLLIISLFLRLTINDYMLIATEFEKYENLNKLIFFIENIYEFFYIIYYYKEKF